MRRSPDVHLARMHLICDNGVMFMLRYLMNTSCTISDASAPWVRKLVNPVDRNSSDDNCEVIEFEAKCLFSVQCDYAGFGIRVYDIVKMQGRDA